MPLPNLPVPPFPNVPPLPGVPPVLRNAAATVTNTIVGVGEAVRLVQRILGLTPGPQWGIFDDDGQPVITGDSCLSFEYAKDSRVADFPIENGGFESYNKVDLPADCKITFAIGGTTAARSDFLQYMRDAISALDLFFCVTPDISYGDMNIVHYDYRRTVESGVQLMAVDIWLREIREAAAPEFTSTKSPTGEATKNNGTVQATAVPPVVAQERALQTAGDIRP